MASQISELLVRFIQATGLSYAQIAQQIGCSAKTVQRTVAGESRPLPSQLHTLAAIAHPRDRDLAARLAAAGGTNLEALGLAKRAPSGAAHADLVLCAAAEAMDVSPRAMRAALAAAFARANELGYSVPDLARVFVGAKAPKG